MIMLDDVLIFWSIILARIHEPKYHERAKSILSQRLYWATTYKQFKLGTENKRIVFLEKK